MKRINRVVLVLALLLASTMPLRADAENGNKDSERKWKKRQFKKAVMNILKSKFDKNLIENDKSGKPLPVVSIFRERPDTKVQSLDAWKDFDAESKKENKIHFSARLHIAFPIYGGKEVIGAHARWLDVEAEFQGQGSWKKDEELRKWKLSKWSEAYNTKRRKIIDYPLPKDLKSAVAKIPLWEPLPVDFKPTRAEVTLGSKLFHSSCDALGCDGDYLEAAYLLSSSPTIKQWDKAMEQLATCLFLAGHYDKAASWRAFGRKPEEIVGPDDRKFVEFCLKKAAEGKE